MTHHAGDLSRRHVLAWTTSAAAVAATANKPGRAAAAVSGREAH